jgi:signal transduction histidine kinase
MNTALGTHIPRHLVASTRRAEIAALAAGAFATAVGIDTYLADRGRGGGVTLLALGIAVGGVLLVLRTTTTQARRASDLVDELGRAEATALERQAVVSMLAQLARRSCRLLDEQVTELGGEVGSELDRRATRLRRAAEGVIALAAPTPAESDARADLGERRAVSLPDVVRLALAEVEEPNRVDIEVDVPRQVSVSYAAAIAHVLAELIENAPGAAVLIRAEPVMDGTGSVVLAVDDHGTGMGDDALAAANELLANPRPVPPGAQRLGLQVVSRLAQQLGTKVWLARRPGGGLTARAKLPAAVFTDHDPEGDVVVDLEGGGSELATHA